MSLQAIIQENARRREAFSLPYNPYSGYGSVGDRKQFLFEHHGKKVDWNIPVEMFDEPLVQLIQEKGSIENALNSLESLRSSSSLTPPADLFQQLIELRYSHDFEFWARCRVKIQNKQTKKIVPFILRKAQQKLLEVLETLRKMGKTVWGKLLKARQWGGSTLIQIWFAWIQCVLERNWHSVIVADVEDQTKTIRAMYTRFAKEYGVTLLPFEGSTKNKIVKERGCVISIGSMQKPDSLRSSDNSLIHCSEVGLWKKTDGKSPEDLIQSLIASVPEAPNCAFILESTAKGVGNYWHSTWINNHAFTPIFVPWFEIEMYQAPLDSLNSLESFISSWNDYEKFLWSLGATIEGINWYRGQLEKYSGDTWRMQSEFPSTETEAFQSTGRRFYPPIYIEQARKGCTPPAFKGDIFADTVSPSQASHVSQPSHSLNFSKSLKSFAFHESPSGQLWVWAKPDEKPMSDRYIVAVDIGGVSQSADYSSINVFDRSEMSRGGGIERVATWHGHLDQDLLAWLAAQIATWYNNALLVIEVNSLNSKEEEGTEGLHHITILNEIGDHYPNLYTRNNPEKSYNQEQPKYGFHMNRATKPAVMEAKRAAMRDGLFTERDERAVNEADTIEINDRGQIGAVVGCHDDIEVPTATAIYVSNEMPVPKEITRTTTYRRTIAGEATF